MKKYQVGFSKAGGVQKNYRQHKRTYKQKKQTEIVITEPTLSVFRCNSRWKSTNKGNCKFITYLNVVTLYTVPYVSMCPDLSLLAQPCQSCGNTRVKYNICLRKKSWAGRIYMRSVWCPILYFHHHWAQQISTGSYIKKSVGSV